MEVKVMKNNEPMKYQYIIEREFLSKVTVAEFVNRIIQSHADNHTVKDVVSSSVL